MKHIPRKRFGQHFLHDQTVLHKIIYAISPKTNDIIVEIGPGLGAITQFLLKSLIQLHVIECDRNLVTYLKNKFYSRQLHIHLFDALKFDFTSIAIKSQRKIRIIGNLPYNISTPLLFYLTKLIPYVQDQHFMLQKEVVERLVAKPGSKAFGRLSVMLQWRYNIKLLFLVQPTAFNPQPNVTSAVVRMIPITQPLLCEQTLLEKIVTKVFSQRRKIMRNCIVGLLTINDLIAVDIDPQLRPEAITITQYVKLANQLRMQLK